MFGDAGDDLYGGPESDSLSGGWGSDSKSQNGNSGASCDCETAACDKPEPQPPAHADFGDAPDSYGTTLSANGANHTAVGPRFDSRDVESNGTPSPLANRDDFTGVDDEDGVSISTLTVGSSATVLAAAGGVLEV
jgi:hypothetical protein